MSQAWFFFELMVKSMAEYLSAANLINASRKSRFPSQFTDDCTALVVMITKEVIEKYGSVCIPTASVNLVQVLHFNIVCYFRL